MYQLSTIHFITKVLFYNSSWSQIASNPSIPTPFFPSLSLPFLPFPFISFPFISLHFPSVTSPHLTSPHLTLPYLTFISWAFPSLQTELRRILNLKDMELRHLRSLATSILDQRTETEQFLLEALRDVRGFLFFLIYLEKIKMHFFDVFP
jgi:hypothetical protein